jgi:hypothetical protein
MSNEKYRGMIETARKNLERSTSGGFLKYPWIWVEMIAGKWHRASLQA